MKHLWNRMGKVPSISFDQFLVNVGFLKKMVSIFRLKCFWSSIEITPVSLRSGKVSDRYSKRIREE